uniref:Myelin basic protein n=1 Tax=Macrostomum lignano TaxID=282301 RepID=A0A1I8G2A9_9PLAT
MGADRLMPVRQPAVLQRQHPARCLAARPQCPQPVAAYRHSGLLAISHLAVAHRGSSLAQQLPGPQFQLTKLSLYRILAFPSTASTPGANRRTFVPNLNAKSREKDKQPDRQKQAQKPKDSFNGAGRSSSSAKKPGKDQPDGKSNRPSHGNFVQTHSIFAEGLGGSERSTAGQARGRGFGGGGGGGRASSAAADEPV